MVKKVYDPIINKRFNSIKCFTHIRAYHGCRPLSVDDYLKNGIRRRSKEELLKEACLRLRSSRASDHNIKQSFEAVWKEYGYGVDNRGVYLNAWKDELLNYSAHYLLYGSELIIATAGGLALDEREAMKFRNELKKTGKPTLFVCDIPIEDIRKNFLDDIAANMPIQEDTTILVDHVEPGNIVGIEYPEKLMDVYNGNIIYRV